MECHMVWSAHVLFNIFINDWMKRLTKVADDIKLSGLANTIEDRNIIQNEFVS